MHSDYHSLSRGLRRTSYFAGNFAAYLLPDAVFRARLKGFLDSLTEQERAAAQARACYYCRLPEGADITAFATEVGQYRFPFGQKHKMSAYFFDLYQAIRYFPTALKFHYLFGDVSWEEPHPTIVKTRPIAAGSSNNVVMKLNRMRHFYFPADPYGWDGKADKIVFRNVVRLQPWRAAFVARWIDHEMCDIGATNADCGQEQWVKPYLTIAQQQRYKFVATIEGNDVATNLKWVMASNSIAVMPRPRMESWFMEGRLKPDYHYIEVRKDYSDLAEKLRFYLDHPAKAHEIIDNAHRWVAQFGNNRIEKAAQLLTLQRYFGQTNQLDGFVEQ